jgi:hypothetical protein
MYQLSLFVFEIFNNTYLLCTNEITAYKIIEVMYCLSVALPSRASNYASHYVNTRLQLEFTFTFSRLTSWTVHIVGGRWCAKCKIFGSPF